MIILAKEVSRWGLVVAGLAWLMSVTACGNEQASESTAVELERRDDEQRDRGRSRPPHTRQDGSFVFDVIVPADIAVARQLQVVGLESIDIEDGVELRDTQGQFLPVANLGTGRLRLGRGAKTGNLLARGDVVLEAGAQVRGDLTTQGRLRQASCGRRHCRSIDGTIRVETEIQTTSIPQRVRFPNSARPAVRASRNHRPHRPLSPGRYASLMLEPGSELTLVAGDYYFDTATLKRGSHLRIDDREGRASVYVGRALEISGNMASVRGEAFSPDLVVTYLGTGTVSVTGALRGGLLAPNGGIDLDDSLDPLPPPFRFILGRNLTLRRDPILVDPTSLSCEARGDGALCSDGVLCTVDDRCSGGVCVGAPAVCVTAPPECHVPSSAACDAPSGRCVAIRFADGTACEEIAGGRCTAGVCSSPALSLPTAAVDLGTVLSDSERGDDVDTEESQGIAESDRYFYWITVDAIYAHERTTPLSLPNAVAFQTGIPSQLAGYNHFGDGDFYNGFLLVPLTGGPVDLVVAFDEELNLRSWAPLQFDDGSWVSVNPLNGFLYTSENHNPPFSVHALHAYDIQGLLAAAGEPTPREAALVHGVTIALPIEFGFPETCPDLAIGPFGDPCASHWDNFWIQGGDFSPNGVFYYVEDDRSDRSDFSGVHVFNVSPRIVAPDPPTAAFVPVSPDSILNIEYDGVNDLVSLFSDNDRGDELEGITVFESAGTTHVFVQLLSNEADEDDVSVYHFQVNEP